MKRIAVIVVTCIGVFGCAEDKPPTDKPAERPDRTAQTKPATRAPETTPTTRPPAETRPRSPQTATSPETAPAVDFAARMARIRELREDGEFKKALLEARALRKAAPNHPDGGALDVLMHEIQQDRRDSYRLPMAVEKLAGNEAAVEFAKRQLLGADRLGRIFLRKAVRTEEPAIAINAAEALIADRDAKALSAFVDRLTREVDNELSRTLVNGLATIRGELRDRQISPCLDLIADDEPFARTALAGVLVDVFDKGCDADPATFNERAGRPDAYAILNGYVQRALRSDAPAAEEHPKGPAATPVAWACRDGGSLRRYFAGARASWYADDEFDELAVRTIDPQIYIDENRHLPYENGRLKDASARWTGLLRVPADGEYTFYCKSDDEGRVLIDGKQAVKGDRGGGKEGKVKLTAGLHEFRADWDDDDGGIHMRVEWWGPGVKRTRDLPLIAVPWPEKVRQLGPAVERLASEDYTERRAARGLLTRAGPVGRMFLRHTLRTRDDDVAAGAIALLAELDDARSIPRLLDKLRATRPGAPRRGSGRPGQAGGESTDMLRRPLVLALRRLAMHLPAEEVGTLMAAVRAEKDHTMPPAASILCAVREALGAETFAARAGGADAAKALRRYVQACLRSEDRAAVARALEFGRPFSPLLPGLRATFYNTTDYGAPAGTVLARDTHVDTRKFPHPKGTQKNFSARYEGLLRVPRTGEYEFRISAEHWARIFIDGKPVQDAGGHPQSAKRSLKAGLHTIRIDYVEDRGDDNARLKVEWDGPDFGDRVLDARELACVPWPEHIDRLGDAADGLAAEQPATRVTSRRTLEHAGEVGRVYLRNLIRYGDEPALLRAGRLLVYDRDPLAPPVIRERIDRQPAMATSPALCEAMRGLVGVVKSGQWSELLASVQAEKTPRMTVQAAGLCAALEFLSNRDAEAFGALTGDPDAAGMLRAHVTAALRSDEDAVVARACRFGGPVAPYVPGVWGVFYEGRRFARAYLARYEDEIYYDNRKRPHPERQEDLSARWTGLLRLPRDGKYKFKLYGDDDLTLLLNQERVVRSEWRRWEENEREMSTGSYAFRVEFRQGDNDSHARVEWDGPGFGESRLDAPHLLTPPSAQSVAEAPDAVRNLASKDAAVARTAWKTLRDLGPVGDVYLRNALRHGKSDAVKTAAAGMLIRRRDPAAAGLLISLLKGGASGELERTCIGGLTKLAYALDARDVRWFYETRATKLDRPTVEVLCALFEGPAGRDAKRYNALTGATKAHEKLRSYLDAFLEGDNLDALVWAATVDPAGPMRRGLRERLYAGKQWRKLLATREQEHLDIDRSHHFKVPGDRKQNFSCWWDGFVKVDKGGTCRFWSDGDDGHAVWVDAQRVADGLIRRMNDTVSGRIELSPGLHRVEVGHYQGEGGASIKVEWSAPGVERQRLDADHARRHVLVAEVRETAEELERLTDKDGRKRNRARDRLKKAGELGKLLLWHAVRHRPEKAARAAAEVLEDMKDTKAAAVVKERFGEPEEQ